MTVDSAVEPTRSQNITVSCRRSASSRWRSMGADVARRRLSAVEGSVPQGGDRGQQLAAMADRGDAEADQVSAVSSGSTSPSISLSRNAGAYCSSPSPRSHAATSMR